MRIFSLLVVLVLAPLVHAQQALPEPQINADRTVTFRFAAPGATKVVVAVEGMRAPLALVKNDTGTWVATTSTLKPEWYSYHFVVDGATTLDPHNVIIKSSYLASGNGFLVPAATPEPWEPTAVPHGTVHHHTFTSKVVQGLEGAQSEYFVYTPPGYDARGATRYPVLYLLHGWSDTAGGWTTIGHANDVLDNLIAQGKAKPMVVVMPLGYGDMSFVRQGFGIWNDADAVNHNTRLFAEALLSEVVPQVEKIYSVSTRREDRAIAGLSMGGLESLGIGLKHADLFAYVGGFSSAVHQYGPTAFADVNPKEAKLKLVWIACGTEDDLITPNRKLVGVLKGEGFNVTAVETPGMHTWLVWRDNLRNFAPLLFQGR